MYKYELAISGSYTAIPDAIDDLQGITKTDEKFSLGHQDWVQVPRSDNQNYSAKIDSTTTAFEDFVSILKVKYPNLDIVLARL